MKLMLMLMLIQILQAADVAWRAGAGQTNRVRGHTSLMQSIDLSLSSELWETEEMKEKRKTRNRVHVRQSNKPHSALKMELSRSYLLKHQEAFVPLALIPLERLIRRVVFSCRLRNSTARYCNRCSVEIFKAWLSNKWALCTAQPCKLRTSS